MKKLLVLPITILALCCTAQTISKNNAHIISSKANKGGLYHIDLNKEEGTLYLTYLLKKKKNMALTEVYQFDLETLEFKSSSEQEEDLEKKYPAKKGGNKILRVLPATTGQIKLQLGHIVYSYNTGAFGNTYVMQNFVKDKEVKPKGEDGDRISYVMHQSFESDEQMASFHGDSYNLNIGDLQVLGVVKSEPLYTKYESMVYDASNLTAKNRVSIDLPYSYDPIVGKNLPNGNMALILKPITMKDVPKPKASKGIIDAYRLAPNTNYRYMEILPNGEVLHNFEFEMKEPESGWTIKADIVPCDDGGVMVVGTLKPLKVLGPPLKRVAGAATISLAEDPVSIGQKDPDYFFATRLKEGKQIYHTTMPWSDILKNMVTHKASTGSLPGSISKYIKYDYLAAGWVYSADGRDVIMFQRNGTNLHHVQLNGTSGTLEANYLIYPEKKRIISSAPGPRHFLNQDGKPFVLLYEQVEEKDPNQSKQEQALATLKVFSVAVDPFKKELSEKVDISPGGNFNYHEGLWKIDDNTFISHAFGRKKEIVLTKISF